VINARLGLVPGQRSSGGKPKLLGIASGETSTCGSCWWKVHEPRSLDSIEASTASDPGSISSKTGSIRTSPLWHWPTSWHASHGPSFSHLSDPKDAVTIAVQFSKLPSGFNHVATAQINGVSKQMTVSIQNFNYQVSQM
jgi:hypothetical protein